LGGIDLSAHRGLLHGGDHNIRGQGQVGRFELEALVWLTVVVIFALELNSASAAEECTQQSEPIETDRPDTTNSSVVVPMGSLQNENGANVSRRNGADIFDGTNSRWRLGVGPCFEVLVDLPNYVGTFHGSGASGFGDGASIKMADQSTAGQV
jgi:hypothetical protein